MKNYIITSIKTEEKRGVFFIPKIGKRRIYRSSFNNTEPKFKILSFVKKENAQKTCDEINKAYNDNFEVEEINL